MKKAGRRETRNATRRTTLTLPTRDLEQARRIARSRKVSLSAVVAELVAEGLRVQAAARRGEEVLAAYRRAFGGFSNEEMMLLDGIVMKPRQRRR